MDRRQEDVTSDVIAKFLYLAEDEAYCHQSQGSKSFKKNAKSNVLFLKNAMKVKNSIALKVALRK